MRAAAAALLLLLALAAAQRMPDIPAPETSFHVEATSANGCGLPGALASSLQSNGFTKVVCPFGILAAGTADYPDNYLLLAANIVAELLDLDKNGVADDPAVVSALSYQHADAVWLAGGTSRNTEDRCDSVRPQRYCFGLQTYHADSPSLVREIATEETFHMLQQFGWGVVHPEAVSVRDFTTSVACREMARLECVRPGWWHEENTCPAPTPRQPGNPATPPLRGTCNQADCDCTEFYHQAALRAAGQAPAWNSPYMPRTQTEMREMLSSEFKAMLADPRYHQIQSPLTYSYTAMPRPRHNGISVGPVPGELAEFRAWFEKYVNVWGLNIFASSRVTDVSVLHAANVMAQFLDNNADGEVDNPAVVDALNRGSASMVMFADDNDPMMDNFFRNAPRGYHYQDLHDDETIPDPSQGTRHDATVEEVYHLLTSGGWGEVYPSVYGCSAGTVLSNAMDALIADCGHAYDGTFSYPGCSGFYHYSDRTCNYRCLAVEYHWWLMGSVLGYNAGPPLGPQNRCGSNSRCNLGSCVDDEWELCTKERVQQHDAAGYAVFTDPQYASPTVLPDGVYMGRVPSPRPHRSHHHKYGSCGQAHEERYRRRMAARLRINTTAAL